MSKMDTQGMSPELTPEEREAWEKSGKKQQHKPATIIPRRLFTETYAKEMKILINEVLDEREHKKKLKGPYDLYEDLDDLKPSYFDTEHFKYLVGEEEPPYNGR
tara:strand:+ start:164 stop:475 length:312 start_codon:yes stop_codon:yes gene_type:complete